MEPLFDDDQIKALIEKGLLSQDFADKYLKSPEDKQSVVEIGKDILANHIADQITSNPETADLAARVDDKVKLRAEDFAPYLEHQESGGDSNAVSPKGALGLRQVMPATGEEVYNKLGMVKDYGPFNPSLLKNPEINAKIGDAYLQEQLDKYQDPKLALAAYNAGPGNVDNAIKATGTPTPTWEQVQQFLPKPQETVPYVNNIMTGYGKANTPTPTPTAAPNLVNTAIPDPTATTTATPAATLPNMPLPEGTQAPIQATGWPDLPPSPEAPAPTVTPATTSTGDNAGQANAPVMANSAKQATGEISPTSILEQSLQNSAAGIGMQQEGIASKAKIESEQNLANAQIYNDALAQLNTPSERLAKQAQDEKEFDDRVTVQKQMIDQISKMSIDTSMSGYFAHQSTWQKIIAGIGIGLSSASGSATNKALDVIDGAIDRDVQAQKFRFEALKTAADLNNSLIGQMRQKFGDDTAIENTLKQGIIQKTIVKIDAQAAQSNSDIVKANAASMIGDLQKQLGGLQEQFYKNQQGVIARQVPGYGYANTEKDANDLKEILPDAELALKNIEYLKNAATLGAKLPGEEKAKISEIATQLMGQLRKPTIGSGQMTKFEIQILENLISNPSEYFRVPSWARARLQTLEDNTRAKIDNELRLRGLPPRFTIKQKLAEQSGVKKTTDTEE